MWFTSGLTREITREEDQHNGRRHENGTRGIAAPPQIDDLDGKRMEFVERTRSARVERLEASAVNTYVEDLRALLSKGSVMEQKSFPRSFIKRIAVELPHVTIDYTISLKTTKTEPSASEVLSFAYSGGP